MLRSRLVDRVVCPSRRYSAIANNSREPSVKLQLSRQAWSLLRTPDGRGAVVKSWRIFDSMAEAYALLRAVEEKYGPIHEYWFQKDQEDPSKYTSVIRVQFKNAESLQDITFSPQPLHTVAPIVPVRPGGIGLDDLKGLLAPRALMQKSTDGTEPMPDIGEGERVMDASISKAAQPLYTPGISINRKIVPRNIKAIYDWGGFFPLEPLPEGAPLTTDHPHMRMALQRWTYDLNFRPPPNSDKSDAQKRVTPHSGYTRTTRREAPPVPQAPIFHAPVESPSSPPPSSYRPVPAPVVKKSREPWDPLPKPVPQQATATADAAPVEVATQRTQPSPPPSPVRKAAPSPVSLPEAADIPYIDLPPVVTRRDRKARLMAAQQAINPTPKTTKASTQPVKRPKQKKKKEKPVEEPPPPKESVIEKLKKTFFGSWFS
ncbi:uncharacterized protein BT62DRAFT_928400 [Guyanagaster necrorhizus]|uniref:Uncharacterized protein n=1 Tax=Guyanagaster necrorhizus TaxID=856835 RepID=A0A9P7VZ80_9AGAR|nr:uncharacterized protein BT62DRAFT_928400 [Guyanagaster necrorhizus MCA 3950]KAG7449672.1 hypothetical protein BT62DRAFT_928400 [Guyanagaster necrorhizus MCA 3950]